MTREDLIEQIVEASIRDQMFLPANEFEMKKLANRGMVGHLAHGWLRGVSAGGIIPPVGPVFNILRYAKKVGYANKGLHRGIATLDQKGLKVKAVKKKKGPQFDESIIEAIVEGRRWDNFSRKITDYNAKHPGRLEVLGGLGAMGGGAISYLQGRGEIRDARSFSAPVDQKMSGYLGNAQKGIGVAQGGLGLILLGRGVKKMYVARKARKLDKAGV